MYPGRKCQKNVYSGLSRQRVEYTFLICNKLGINTEFKNYFIIEK